jgi:hypothetical protein
MMTGNHSLDPPWGLVKIWIVPLVRIICVGDVADQNVLFERGLRIAQDLVQFVLDGDCRAYFGGARAAAAH